MKLHKTVRKDSHHDKRFRIDSVRATEPEVFNALSDKVKRLIGYHVRVPSSLEEFYLPEEEG